MQNTLMQGAKKIVEACLNILPGEKVLIITDFATERNIAQALREAASERDAQVSILTVEPGKMPGEEPSELIRIAMEHSDVIMAATRRTIMHSEAATSACRKGARLFTLTECTEETLRSGAIEADFSALLPVFEQLCAVFDKGNSVHVTTRHGTDIRLSITGRKTMACTGICTSPGDKMGFPDAEVYIAPIEDSTEGILVVDASSSEIGLIREPIVITVVRGKVSKIEGGEEARKLKDILQAANDEGAMVVAEFAFGLNYMGNVVGNIIEDEGVYGTGHFALGNNLHFGGTNRSSIHIDMVYWKPTIEVDGEIVLKDGVLAHEYRIPELEMKEAAQ